MLELQGTARRIRREERIEDLLARDGRSRGGRARACACDPARSSFGFRSGDRVCSGGRTARLETSPERVGIVEGEVAAREELHRRVFTIGHTRLALVSGIAGPSFGFRVANTRIR